MSEESKFEEYLLSEYSNITEAHVKSIETISTFFRYYLLVMSAPITLVAISVQILTSTTGAVNLVERYELFISIALISISVIGIGILCYIINLRMDTILYARVVNGIRKYFYDSSKMDINLKLRMRVLPQNPQLPSYREYAYFLPVVVVFGLVNTLYFIFGLYIFNNSNMEIWIVYSSFLCMLIHYFIYYLYSQHRETSYLRSNIMGVDIDGVLNKHREHFCSLLYEKTGKEIEPKKITVIPVHEHPNLNISRDEERKVFNDPRYWKEMPVIENAAEVLKKMRNALKIKVYIFTWRPWPDTRNEFCEHFKNFLNECEGNAKKCFFKLILWVLAPHEGALIFFKEKPLKQISQEWLKKHEFKYNRFIFEKGNDYSSDPRGEFNNRFYKARAKKIKFFVEDDLEKAIKLSYICDIVFLFDQPYNRKRKGMPSNIIIVKSWNDIYKKMRKFT